MEAHGHNVKETILHQDNNTAILLENNGKMKLRQEDQSHEPLFFFLVDQAERRNIRSEHCPTNEMNGDCVSEPIMQRSLIEKLRSCIMGHKHVLPPGGNRSMLKNTTCTRARVCSTV